MLVQSQVLPVVVLSPRHKAEARYCLSGYGQAGSPLLEEAVLGQGVPGEPLPVGPEGASLLQPAPSLASSGRPGVDTGLVIISVTVTILVQVDVVAREVGVDVGALGQGKSVAIQDRSWTRELWVMKSLKPSSAVKSC